MHARINRHTSAEEALELHLSTGGRRFVSQQLRQSFDSHDARKGADPWFDLPPKNPPCAAPGAPVFAGNRSRG
eukprot:scaffold64_cov338-Pavlova_lutheri.AAC.3